MADPSTVACDHTQLVSLVRSTPSYMRETESEFNSNLFLCSILHNDTHICHLDRALVTQLHRKLAQSTITGTNIFKHIHRSATSTVTGSQLAVHYPEQQTIKAILREERVLSYICPNSIAVEHPFLFMRFSLLRILCVAHDLSPQMLPGC